MIALSEDKARTCLIDYARIAAENGNLDEAKTLFRGCQEYVDLSVVLARERRYEEAIEMATAALRESPVRAHAQLMAIYSEMGNLEKCEEHVNAGLALSPTYSKLLQARAVLRLGRRDPAGWADLHHTHWHRELAKSLPETEWRGEFSIEGKHLLVIGQEGFGDQMMYSRFLPELVKRYKPGKLTVAAPGQLQRLFRRSFTGIEFLHSHTRIEEHVDAWISSGLLGELNLPHATEPYLSFTDESAQEYARLFPNKDRLRVGLVWGGSVRHTQDRNRSIPFEFYRPLLEVPGCDFYSLQFGEPYASENRTLPDLAKYSEDFADTAAMLAHLDLVITVDTSMVHVAGGVGTPTWVLLSTPFDWRWGLPGEHNDWYQGVRQFRNAKSEQLAAALKEYAADLCLPLIHNDAPVKPKAGPEAPRALRTALDLKYLLQQGDCHPGLPRASEYHASEEWLGSVSYEEAMFLYGLCMVRKPALAVELGTAEGFSTVHLARAIADSGYGSLVAIEMDLEKVRKTRERLVREHLVADLRRMDASEYLASEERPIDFLFIDTELEDRWKQFELAWDRLSPEGLVVFHDVSPLHPVRALSNIDLLGLLRAKSISYSYIPSPRGMALISKEV